MKRRILLPLVGLATCLSLGIPELSTAHNPPITSNSSSLAPMLERVTPCVVNITVEKKVPAFILHQLPPNLPKDALPRNLAIGSGVIFDAEKGLIITNAHVVKNQKAMVVTLKDGRRFLAKLIASADDFDLAIIAIHAKHLNSLPFGDSDKLQVGDFVAAIGSPFGLTQSVTSGVISALNRDKPKIEGFQSFIQTDAPINPGNSGGALVDMQGRLIGINTAIISGVDSSAGIGFAIPSNMTQSVITQLLKYGKVERGVLGVMAQNISADLASVMSLKSTEGALVTQIVPHSPASQTTLKAGDVIEQIDHKVIKSADQLRNDLGIIHPGTTITLQVNRDNHHFDVQAKVANLESMQAEEGIPFFSGTQLRDFKELQSNGEILTGVEVVDSEDTSNAALAGLQNGDVIVSVAKDPVHNVKELKEKILKIHQDQLLLTFARDNTRLYTVIEKQ